MFLSPLEKKLSNEFLDNGYVIRPVADMGALQCMQDQFIELIADTLGVKSEDKSEDILNQIHLKVPVNEINNFRLKIIRGFNALPEFRKMYFSVARPYLETLVGNELAMQLRINLSIQFPGDTSSLLPVHADTWSGDSPFEVVAWLPLVDCYRTKAMYLLPPGPAAHLGQRFFECAGGDSEQLYQSIKDKVEQLTVSYGEVLIFNQALPHGNRLNEETETRWSMNCRFKGVFTPYGDKKLGEFFEPITLRAASRAGMKYKLPKVS
jgi:sporadic carbohydrate cluster 2OG-Fe(II) oxygenase